MTRPAFLVGALQGCVPCRRLGSREKSGRGGGLSMAREAASVAHPGTELTGKKRGGQTRAGAPVLGLGRDLAAGVCSGMDLVFDAARHHEYLEPPSLGENVNLGKILLDSGESRLYTESVLRPSRG